MSKIGIKINNISSGLAVAFQANADINNWTLNTHDTRDDLRSLGFRDATGGFTPLVNAGTPLSAPILMLSFDTGGCYLCSIKLSSGRLGDHVASWFYIPREADINAARMRQLLNLVNDEVATGGVINEARLNGEFLRDEPTRRVLPVYANSNRNAGYAVRYYGQGTSISLDDLLGRDMYQPEYARYKAVFLIDKSSALVCNGAADLTTHPLALTATVFPPAPNNLGMAVYCGNQPFTAPIVAYRGSTLQLTWRAGGFKDVVKQFQVNAEQQQCPNLNDSDVRWLVPYSHFNIVDDTLQRNVTGCNISVMGRPLALGQTIDVPFFELKRGIRVKVSKHGYVDAVADYHGKPIKVQLEKQQQNYVFIFPDGSKVALSGDKEFQQSPFAGYSANNDGRVIQGQNRLHKTNNASVGGFSLKSMLLGALAGALLVGLVWLLTGRLRGDKPNPEASLSTEVPVPNPLDNQLDKPQPLPQFEVLNAPVWNRDSLEKAGFKGLWEALNTYKINEVMKFDGEYPDLRKVPNWERLVKSIINLQQTGYTNFPGKFNNDGDMNITIDNYIKKIEKLTLPTKHENDIKEPVSPTNKADGVGKPTAKNHHADPANPTPNTPANPNNPNP